MALSEAHYRNIQICPFYRSVPVQTISISPLTPLGRPLHFRSHNSSSVPTNITTERECCVCVLKELWANGWLLDWSVDDVAKEEIMSGLSSFEYSWVGENCTDDQSPAQLLFHFQALPLPILNILNASGWKGGRGNVCQHFTSGGLQKNLLLKNIWSFSPINEV